MKMVSTDSHKARRSDGMTEMFSYRVCIDYWMGRGLPFAAREPPCCWQGLFQRLPELLKLFLVGDDVLLLIIELELLILLFDFRIVGAILGSATAASVSTASSAATTTSLQNKNTLADDNLTEI